MADRLTDDVKKALRQILSDCKREDLEIRKSQIKEWKKFEEYWRGVQHLFWSEQGQTWLSADTRGVTTGEDDNNFGPFYDYVVNIYRAHGEAIIAALSAKLPTMRFVPDDADDTNDVLTSRTYDRIADLVQRHNNAAMIFMKGIFYLWNGGVVASYRYKDADLKYGSYEVPEYGTSEEEVTKQVCKDCGYEVPVDAQDLEGEPNLECPQCGGPLKEVTDTQETPQQIGTKTLPKTRVKLAILGPLQFKVPYWASNQDECDYLLYFIDAAKSVVKATLQPDFENSELVDQIEGENLESTDRFSRTGFMFPDSPDFQNSNKTTITQAWFRPSTFWKISDKKTRKKLVKMFPDGVHCTFVGKQDILVDTDNTAPENESLDKRWDIGQAGLSTNIYSDAIGKPLIPISDMTNQLANMTMDTIDHGNPSTFADSEVINFDQYGKMEAMPGMLYKAKRKPNEPLSASFYQEPRTTLSKEVPVFKQQLDQSAQFVVGSFPSIYGGPSEGKSRTFSEYSQSRAMALQRLQISWQFIVDWWKRTVEGCVRMYVETVVEDQKDVRYIDNKYVNVWIRASELKGKVGGVESEASENFPVSMMQKNALIQKLIELNNPMINQFIFSPENASIIKDNFALNELKIPGDLQRIKQTVELDELTKTAPISPVQSSIPIDVDIDDHAVHAETVKTFLIDVVGMDLKKTNPMGYANCIAHLKEHEQQIMIMKQNQMMQEMQANGAKPQKGPNDKK